MELRHYRYFLAAAEDLNISKASRRLNVSQPAVSRLILQLEDELGVPLFKRERFGLTLTSAGEELVAYARKIIDLSDESIRTLRKQHVAKPTIAIGFMASSLSAFLGAALNTFHKSHPDLTIKIHELSPADQLKTLHKKEIDIALIGNLCGTVNEEFETRVLFEMKLKAVLPTSHRLASRKRISLQELAEEDFIGYSDESFPGRNQTITDACHVAGFTPALKHKANSLVEVLAMIGTGSGVCLMPADVVSLPHPGTVFIPVRDTIEPIRFTAAWRRSDTRQIISQILDGLKPSVANKIPR